MHYDIQGILQFQIFQVPMVGADTCGFSECSAYLSLQPKTTSHMACKVGNSDEELCNRWMQLSAFAPFYRNHNIKAAIGQEPYRWDSVAKASRNAIAIRYALLPYWVGHILVLFLLVLMLICDSTHCLRTFQPLGHRPFARCSLSFQMSLNSSQ